MNILDRIIAQKRIEVAEKKLVVSIAQLEKGNFFEKQNTVVKKIFVG